jgi:N utilization substance protein B
VGARRKARECGLQLLYQLEANVQSAHAREKAVGGLEGAEGVVGGMLEVFFESFDANERVKSYAEKLVRGVAQHYEQIDALISENSPKWKLERMAMVDRNVLRIATYELLFEQDVPPNVIVDEAIEVARRFGSEKSSAFVNGVVDPIAKGARS